MKTCLTTIFFILLLSGCTQHNAFEKFQLDKTRELSEDSIQTLKIKKAKKVAGIISVIYLNKVLPQKYHDNEYFYVYYYIKDKNAKVTFLLNNQKVLFSEELPAKNQFSELTSFNAPWSKYYLIAFKKEGNILNLKIKTDKAANAALRFVKDK